MLVDVLMEATDRAPRKEAVADGRARLTYRQLAILASVLRDEALRQSDKPNIGVMLPSSAIFAACLFGVLWARRTVVPLNFLLNPDELVKVVRDAGLDLIITVKPFAELTAKLPARSIFVDELPLKTRSLFASFRRRPPVPDVDPHDTAVLLYTSGTMAEPKGVELTYGNLHSNCIDAIESLDIDPNQTFLNILPPFHVFGLTANVIIPVVLKARVFSIPRFNPLAVVRAVPEERITAIMAIPSMYAAILKTKSSPPDTFKNIYLAISGGEPLPEGVRAAFEERFGVVLRQGYGLTETSPVVSAGSVKVWRDGTVGKPIRNTEVRIVDADDKPLPTGQDGEIHVRGPGVMKGYYNRPEETRRVLGEDGWFRTGDIGRFDADGFLSITGRAKEMLIIGGENVFPREIEAALETFTGVLQVAVIGVSDELRGEAPVAFVLPAEGATLNEQELRNHTKLSLAGYKVPKRIVIREDLPTGPTGKIVKRRLREFL